MKIKVYVPQAGILQIESDEAIALLSLQDLVRAPVVVDLNPEPHVTPPQLELTGMINIPVT